MAVIAAAPSASVAASVGSRVRVSGSTSAQSGWPPTQCTACALAAKVKLGMTTRPVAPRDRSASIRPWVQLFDRDDVSDLAALRDRFLELADSAVVREDAALEDALDALCETGDVRDRRAHQG